MSTRFSYIKLPNRNSASSHGIVCKTYKERFPCYVCQSPYTITAPSLDRAPHLWSTSIFSLNLHLTPAKTHRKLLIFWFPGNHPKSPSNAQTFDPNSRTPTTSSISPVFNKAWLVQRCRSKYGRVRSSYGVMIVLCIDWYENYGYMEIYGMGLVFTA